MNDQEPRPLSPEEERELSAAIRGLADLRVDPEFRRDLKHQFVEGRFDAAEPRSSRAGVPVWRWALLAAAVLAAVILVRLDLQANPWMLRARSGEASLLVDGQVVPIQDADAVRSALRRGGRIEVSGEGTIALGMGEVLQVELTPGLSASLPAPTRRWFASTIELEVREGELRVATGNRFPGAGLEVRTPDGKIEVTGTIFSVVCFDGGTCVCVLEGKIHVGADDDDMDEIPAGMRKVLFRDGSEALISESAPPHRQGLQEFKARLEEAAPPRKSP